MYSPFPTSCTMAYMSAWPGDAAGTGDINAPFSAPTSDFSQQVAWARHQPASQSFCTLFPLLSAQIDCKENFIKEYINTSSEWFIKAPVLIMLPIDTIFPQLLPGAKLSELVVTHKPPLTSRAWNEGCRRLREVLQSWRRPLLGPLPYNQFQFHFYLPYAYHWLTLV